jgi:2'-5' RNA ligase
LPEQKIAELALKANGLLVKKYGSEIVLNKQNCLPHISLAMGCIDENDIPMIETALKSTAKKCKIEQLRIKGVSVSINPKGQSISSFEIEKTHNLQNLHEQVMESVTQFFRCEATKDMIYPGEPVSPTTIEWIKNYRENSSFENFSPHITIGYGLLETKIEPIEFSPAKLALCHLGNHCTCRQILAEVQIDK